MLRFIRAGCAAAAALVALAACGGGATSPALTPAAQSAAPTAPPAAASRTTIATATLTLVLPHALTTKTAQTVSAHAANARSAQYVNPAANNLIDIYTDGSLAVDLDNQGEANSSIKVQATATGTQTIAVPLFSTNNNAVVAIEWDASHSNILALGETNQGNITPGTGVALSLTMFMVAHGLGIVDVPTYSSPTQMTGGTYFQECPSYGGSTVGFGVYTTDNEGTFVPQAGYGGTSPVTVTGTPAGGSSTIQNYSQLGIYNFVWDSYCDPINLQAVAQNPAYAIWLDISTTNYSSYQNGYYGNYTAGPNQGIWNLYYGYGTLNNGSFNPVMTQTINGAITVYGYDS